jgi:hypothetical protein
LRTTQENIKVWEQAVKERDEHLAELNARLKDFAERLNDSIRRHNALAKQHNEVIALLNTTRGQLAQAYKDLDEALGMPVPEKKATPEKEGGKEGGGGAKGGEGGEGRPDSAETRGGGVRQGKANGKRLECFGARSFAQNTFSSARHTRSFPSREAATEISHG